MSRMRRRLERLVMALCLLPLTAMAGGPSLEGVFEALARHQQLQAGFEEIRSSGMLSMPMSSEGRLVFRAPDYLEKRIEKPFQEIQIIDGDRLQLQRQGRDAKPRVMSLASIPELEMVINTLRNTLGGNLAWLRAHYRIQIGGTETDWHLRLVPLQTSLRFAYLTISGRGDRIHEFRVVQDETTETRTLIRHDD